jgi:hypothetical protein
LINVGYIFYIKCIFYGFFGCTNDNWSITHSLAAFFVLFMIGLVIQTYVLVKIPFTRGYLESLVKKDFLEKYLGKYTGSGGLIKIVQYVGPAVSLIAAETFTANQQSEKFLSAAKCTEENFYRDCEKTHRIPTDQEHKTMCKVRDAYIDKAAHSSGIITRGFTSGFSSFFFI